jgi:hypothetical protein
MKKNARFLFCSLSLVLLGFAGKLEAQKLFFLFGHVQYDMPVDSYFKHNYNYGLGAEAGVGIGVGNTFFVGTLGYSSFEASSANKFGNYSYVPIKGGIRRYLLIGKLLFIQADAGVALVKNEVVNSSRFSADLGLGVKLGPFEVMAVYDGFTSGGEEATGYLSWIGIKGGIRLGL